MSTLSYNGIVLDTIQTTAFRQEAVYDATHTDYLYTKVTIAVKAVFNAGNSPGVIGETPAQTIVRVRKCLLTQCAELIYRVGPTIIVRSPNPGYAEDVKHGPFPLSVNILSITEATFLVEFAVETYILECCAGATLPYLSNRWEEAHALDENWYTKRTIKGRIVFRADLINSGKYNGGALPDDYRGLISPPYLLLQPNFRRVSMDFVAQSDGLALEYTVVDQEEYVMPPDGLTKFTGTHTVSTSKGAVYSEQISVKGYGNATTPKAVLIAKVAQVVIGRLDLGGNKKIKAGYVQDTIHDNTVEVKVETFGGGRPNNFFGLNVAKPTDFSQLDYLFGDRRSNRQPDPGVRGTANLAMLAFGRYLNLCNLSPPGVFDTELRAGVGPPPGSTPENVNTSLTASVVASLPSQPTNFNPQETANGVYTYYEIDTEYRKSEQTLQVPYMDSALKRCAIIPVAQKLMHKIVRFRAERWGLVPTLPTPLTTNTNNVLLNESYRPMNVDLAPDGVTPVYTVSGEYVFAVVDPTLEQPLGGLPPYLNVNYLQTAAGFFTNGLTDLLGTVELRGGP